MLSRSLARIVVSASAFWVSVSYAAAYADCGSIPFSSPIQLVRDTTVNLLPDGGKDVQFDPLEVVVYEPGQRGIILWNGDEEILLLSTDIRTSQDVSILEVIPLPAEPEVRLGDFDTFQKMQQLLIDKSMWRVASGGGVAGVKPPADAAEITFSQKMGVHDIQVVCVYQPAEFLDWVMTFMQQRQAQNPKVAPKFQKIIENYLGRGFFWFVFDTISTTDKVASKEPIEYRFATPNVFYPLEISSLETGKTTVDLLLLTPQPVTGYDALQFAVKRDPGVTVTAKELQPISEDWAAFMAQPEFAMQRVYIRGRMSKMRNDFVVR